jgi:hypothetical protein
MIRAPFIAALVWAAIALLMGMHGGGIRPFLDRHDLSLLVVIAAAGLAAFALKYYNTRRVLLRQMSQRVEIVATSPDQFPGLDIEAFAQYTSELEALGFVMCMDYTSKTDISRSDLSAMGRLFAHPGHKCFADVSQAMAGSIPKTAVGYEFMTALDEGWSLSSSSSEPTSTTYAHRSPRSLWVAKPGATCGELLKNHLEWRSQIARDLGLAISPELSEQHYFSGIERMILENRKAFKRKNVLRFLMDIDRFNRKPSVEWLGDHSKFSRRATMRDAT